MHGELMKVDFEGVPKMVQKITYVSGNATVRLRLFDGQVLYVEPTSIMRYPPSITEADFTPEQLYDAYVGAEWYMDGRFKAS